MIYLVAYKGKTKFVEDNLDTAFNRLFGLKKDKNKCSILIKKGYELMYKDDNSFHVMEV